MSASARRPLKLAILTEFFYPDLSGGTANAVTHLIDELALNFPVSASVFCSANLYRGEGNLPQTGTMGDVQISRVKTPNWNKKSLPLRVAGNFLLTFGAAWKILRSGKFDALVVTTAPPFLPIAALIVRLVNRTPFYYVVYDLEPNRSVALSVMPQSHPVVKLMKGLQREFFKKSAMNLPIGRCMAEMIKGDYNIEDGKIEVIPVGGMNSDLSTENYKSTSDIDKFTVLYSGNLGRYHDFGTILEAAKLISNSENIHLKIAGKGAKRDEIELRIKEEEILNVTVIDPVSEEEYQKMLHEANVCLITMESGIEGTCVPSKMYSIMGAGKPCLGIVSPNSEVAFTLKEENCGVQVDPQNPKLLASEILRLSQCPELVAELGKNGKRAFEAKYTFKIVAGSIYNTISSQTFLTDPKVSTDFIESDPENLGESNTVFHQVGGRA